MSAPSAGTPKAPLFWPAPPDQRVEHWHVSPGIDTLAYSFSWVWLLIPFLIFGPEHPQDYLWYWIVGNSFGFAHRHLTMPYVYFDAQVFKTQAARFLVVPSFLFAGFLASGLYRSWRIPAGFFDRTDGLALAAGAFLLVQWWRSDKLGMPLSKPLLGMLTIAPLALVAGLLAWPVGPEHSTVSIAMIAGWFGLSAWLARESRGSGTTFVSYAAPIAIALLLAAAVASSSQAPVPLGPSAKMRVPILVGGIAAFAGAWNIWHVYMEKYGILRMYAAKSGVSEDVRVPGWVDRLLVFGWLPAYLFFLPIAATPILKRHAPSVLVWLQPILDQLQTAATIGLPVSLLLGLASVGAYFWYEYRASGLANYARLGMGVGTVLLALTFFFFDPFEAYVAFGFSHAVEYIVFVWAFQRRRYRAPLAHKPLLGRMLKHPFVYYGVFFAIVCSSYAVLEYGSGRLYEGSLKAFGTPVRSWIFYWTIWQSMAHFYFDSFLWKMRLSEVRASL
ncbi:MAG: hypothetical protein KC912_11600 [Proteobacteria bacterium]|nr:hypothetical protein [Pseudomonadota bacterium]